MERLIDGALIGALYFAGAVVVLLIASIIVELVGTDRLARWLRLDR